ncbi:MAG: protein-L-isoaspartate O-methyltransferase, partial [Calditrichae bacterium]|nr:protein-L-isoaspartate O-methyltransferase [Calditrichia bacterium]NIV71917.1 protein-L-isoaspartate O-methyltransferase [Calditrichia bacterium]
MYDRHRERMVKECVIDRGITDQRLIAAMGKVPRHQFVETAMSHQAYADKSLPIGHSQTISRPTTVADMTRALQISGQERVLEIGTGSGYQTAILAEM